MCSSIMSKKVHACMLSCFSCIQLFVTPWTVAFQAPLPMGFSRQEYWSGLPFPSSEDLPDPGIEPRSLMSPALASGFFTTSVTWKPMWCQANHLVKGYRPGLGPSHQEICLILHIMK